MTFGYSTAIRDLSATGIKNIDALLDGTKWQSNTVTYSFTSSFYDDYEHSSGYPDSDDHSSSFESLNITQRTIANDWFAMYEDVSLLNTVELTGFEDSDATIRMAESNFYNTAWAFFPNSTVQAGDVWFNSNDYNNPTLGNYAFIVFGHEIGHALGLKHGHETNGVSNVALSADRDSMEFSIMTYNSYIGDDAQEYNNETWGHAQSLMIYDIRAIQEIYGANFDTNSSNTTYTFSTATGEMFVNNVGQGTPGDNRIFRTIWDGDGTDTYNFSNYTTNLSIDLKPGGWSDLDVGGSFQKADLGNDNYHYARGHVFNALQYNSDRRSLIENAIGGSNNDSITGNYTANTLTAGYGSDTVEGGYGSDLIYGDNTDNYSWGDADYLYGGANNDTVYGGGGNDLLEGNNGNDSLDGQGGNDELRGGYGYDTVEGGDGNDLIYGDNIDNYSWGDADYLYGGANNDTVYGGGGNDLIKGHAGYDVLYGQGGNDLVIGGSSSDIINGGSGNDTLIGSYPEESNSGYLEYDNLTGGYGADVFVLGDSTEADYQGYGYITITDFSYLQGDKLRAFGSSSSYSLEDSYWSGDSTQDTIIRYQGDIIAVIEDNPYILLDLDFNYV